LKRGFCAEPVMRQSLFNLPTSVWKIKLRKRLCLVFFKFKVNRSNPCHENDKLR